LTCSIYKKRNKIAKYNLFAVAGAFIDRFFTLYRILLIG